MTSLIQARTQGYKTLTVTTPITYIEVRTTGPIFHRIHTEVSAEVPTGDYLIVEYDNSVQLVSLDDETKHTIREAHYPAEVEQSLEGGVPKEFSDWKARMAKNG